MTDENMAPSALTDGPNSRITHPSTTSSGYRPDRVNMSTAIDLTASQERMYTDSEPNIAASEASPKVTQADEHPGGWDAPKPLEKQVQSSPHQDCQQQSDSIALLPRHSHDALRSGPLEQGGSRNPDQLNPPESHDMLLLSSNESSHAPGYSDLFFDLLFAACLNTYSNAVSLERFSNVAAFLGYFTAIWWAWWSQAYFDVRYRRTMRHQPFLFNSCQRVIRAAVLGLWVAFSTTPSEFSRSSFTNFTLIYGSSRMALALDHAVVLLFDVFRWRRGQSLLHAAGGDDIYHSDDELSRLPSQRTTARRVARNDDMAAIVRTHLISIASLVASGLFWILSRLLPRSNGVTAPLLVMWILGVAIEAAAQILNELSDVLSPLGKGVLPERLVLFGLIILGEGFTGIAETLNRISPGAKLRNEALGGAAIESGGWSGDTILQAVSCVLIIILQFGGYFHRATGEINCASVTIVLWAYIHVLLHMSSALLVIGLKKILSFQNTLNAMSKFFNNPTIYLPNTPPWQDLPPEQAFQPYNDGDGTSPLSTSGMLSGISAIISVIQSNDGANIPTLDQAQKMVASVVGLAGGSAQAQSLVAQANASDASNALSSRFAPSLVLPFKSFFEFADNVVNPDSINKYTVKSLFQFKYIYVASAAYLSVDIVIKTMQSSRDRKLRSFRWAMALRFLFACVLVLLQVVFTVFDGAPSTAALDGALAICASVLLAELICQQIVDGLQSRIDRPRAPKQRHSKLNWSHSSIAAHRQAQSNGSASVSDKDGEESIEMVTQHNRADASKQHSSH
ncbi:hypothetical protein NDA14_006949 [Ustilago hordei]|uniref:Uncharacterized protein n=1 Tax=Ustilago hordei TaxID=120017 RepID=I2FM50_USTHO|nr:uncharacterized protein UHO2_05494 [Ustilago hordei]KAJ1042620.1 hypothetical protein NDA10_001340 [Ustilago hordei]KAJ1572698.1 hypothetical protein NDA15_001015 [Ustilago hordei]KAJ1575777.1 hypothetical protein NDA12_005268 [Ustilago hordei]KAJ1598177.1 hypothetical protein NDA14_006949 [Ustilago hordei]UTT88224.1 hypothetical protein NDA17_001085 [Ustilago hordei]